MFLPFKRDGTHAHTIPSTLRINARVSIYFPDPKYRFCKQSLPCINFLKLYFLHYTISGLKCKLPRYKSPLFYRYRQHKNVKQGDIIKQRSEITPLFYYKNIFLMTGILSKTAANKADETNSMADIKGTDIIGESERVSKPNQRYKCSMRKG